MKKILINYENYLEIIPKISGSKRNFVSKNASLKLENILVSEDFKDKWKSWAKFGGAHYVFL